MILLINASKAAMITFDNKKDVILFIKLIVYDVQVQTLMQNCFSMLSSFSLSCMQERVLFASIRSSVFLDID